MKRDRLLLAALAFCMVQPAMAQRPMKYRFESTTRTTTESSGGGTGQFDIMSMMPGLADQEIKVRAVLTVTVTDSAKGKVYHVVVDSMENNMGDMLEGLGGLMGAAGADNPIKEMMASANGASIHRFVRDGKQISQTMSLINNMQLASILEAVTALAPQPKMLTARWNDSWIDSSGIMMSTASAGSPVRQKQSGFTKWRVTAKDTIEAVVATTMDMDTDSMTNAAMKALPDSGARGGLSAASLSLKMKNQVNGTRRVILDEAKLVVEVNSTLESVANMSMGLIGDLKTKSTATSILIRVPQ